MQNLLLPILMFGALGLMMVFGMRKQKRQAAETQKLQTSIVPGARIMTTSGLHGTVTAVADDTIELEIAPGVRTTWVRAAVRQVVVPALEDDSEFEESDLDERAVVDEDEPRQSDVG
ncbi:MAG: preprotein translocase subunit YajC [Actinobacteria bacterium 69-20]|nr:MAG: preprotein translocase subunit YajC [Actinobacteria bacterium 69-20]